MASKDNIVPLKPIPITESAQDSDDPEMEAIEAEIQLSIREAEEILGPVMFKKWLDQAVDNVLFLQWVMFSHRAIPTTSAFGIPEKVEKAIEERFPGYFEYLYSEAAESPESPPGFLDTFMVYGVANGSIPRGEPWTSGINSAVWRDSRIQALNKYSSRATKLEKRGKRLFQKSFPDFESWKCTLSEMAEQKALKTP